MEYDQSVRRVARDDAMKSVPQHKRTKQKKKHFSFKFSN